MAVGEEVFETVFWSGRFAEAVDPVPVGAPRAAGREARHLRRPAGQGPQHPPGAHRPLRRQGPRHRDEGGAGAAPRDRGDVWAALALGLAWLEGRRRHGMRWVHRSALSGGASLALFGPAREHGQPTGRPR